MDRPLAKKVHLGRLKYFIISNASFCRYRQLFCLTLYTTCCISVWKEELYIKRLQSEITNCVWDGSDLYYHLITNFCGCKEHLVGDIIFSFSNQLEVGFGFKGRDSGCFGRLKEAFLCGWECFWRRDAFADGWLDQAGQLSLWCYCHLLWEARYLAIALCVGASWVEKRLIRRKNC